MADNKCEHLSASWIGQFSMIGSYYCNECGMKIEPFVYHKMKNIPHVYFDERGSENLPQAIIDLDTGNRELWERVNL